MREKKEEKITKRTMNCYSARVKNHKITTRHKKQQHQTRETKEVRLVALEETENTGAEKRQ